MSDKLTVNYGVKPLRPGIGFRVLPPPPRTPLQRIKDAILWEEVTMPALVVALAFTCFKFALLVGLQ